MRNERTWIIGGLIALLIACLCLIFACLALGGLAFLRAGVQSTDSGTEFPPYATVEIQPAEPLPTRNATAQPEPTRTPAANEPNQSEDTGALETLRTLEEAVVPINDPIDLARRLEGKLNIPESVPAPAEPLRVGDEKKFWVSNVETNQKFQVDATLQYATEHLAFWIQQDVNFDPQALRRLAETFENDIYPTNREFFGNEWSPGIDNDKRLYVLFAGGLGRSIAGYFSSADSLHPMAYRYSNAHEMFLLNSDILDLGEMSIYGTMAHEFQHMIHWYRDRNEETWMNEGFSVLAEFLNGLDVGGFDFLYVMNPDIQLTAWPSPPNSTPHYGSAFLFVTYFLDRFGEEATKALVANEDNGMDSVDKVLAALGAVDPLTGQPLDADDVFADWVIATFFNDSNLGDGRYQYGLYPQAPRPNPTEEIDRCTPDWQPRTVKQYGVDYIRILCSGAYTLNFEGNAEVGVLPQDAYSGSHAFWSNKGDHSNMTLTQAFDFSAVSGPLTLSYQTWFDLEEDYDYLYLVASEDGESWQILQPPAGRSGEEDPSGNAYGWGYNGQTGGWIEENVDLSQFAGKQVQLRFEYVTDAAVNGEGLLLDDVRIPEIGYSTDFEEDAGGWQADGFVRIQNRLPQIFRVSLVQPGGAAGVQTFTVRSGERLELPLEIAEGSRGTLLVVSGVTRFTTQEADYRFQFQR